MTAKIFDPITLQILWSRLIGIVDEAGIILVRTSFSQCVQECNDYSCTVMDVNGYAVADNSVSIPAFMGCLPRAMRHILNQLPPETWNPGDVVITNDPWIGTGHLLDISMVAPVFYHDRLAAFVGTVAHQIDVGGIGWGSHAHQVFEEGIRIPISKLMDRGHQNTQLLDIILANNRFPEAVMGDIMAQVTACDACVDRVKEFLEDAGLDDLNALAEAIQDHAEQSMRSAIHEVSDGVYEHVVDVDGLTMRARLTVEGDTLDVDYAGSSPQVDRGINSVMNYTYAYTAYPIKCVLDPGTPKNEGSYRPISVRAPEGSILNAKFPSPVSARHLVGMYCAAAVFGALSKAVPELVIADSSGPPARPVVNGINLDDSPFSLALFPWGGMGARPTKDGLSCTGFPGNETCATVEIMESGGPIIFRCKEIAQDSGGVGKFQGGSGQVLTFEIGPAKSGSISMMSARFRSPAQGLLGGGPGAIGEYLINGKPVAHTGREELKTGDVVTIRYPGGGGYGVPSERDPRLVAQDVANGILTSKRAREFYGVAWEQFVRNNATV